MNTIIKSIRNSIPPIHKEGFPFIGIAAILAIVLGLLWSPLFWIFLGLTIWVVCFFRDPERVTPLDDDLVISPADGKVSAIENTIPPVELDLGDEPMMRVSVFMNVFNCHVNRAPMNGTVSKVAYTEGKFLNAELDKASEFNERNGLVIDTKHGQLGVVQIAGLVARRIVCWTKPNDLISAGERFGLIRFGSRLDVYLPVGSKVMVAIGQTAVAGETVLADYSTSTTSDRSNVRID